MMRSRTVMFRVLRFLVILSGSLFWASPVLSANGPDPATWIPNATTQSAGTFTIVKQNSSLYARDVQKLFIAAVSGYDLRIVKNGNSVRCDFFDQQKDNGLYALIGALEEGDMRIDIQTAPAGTSNWSTEHTLTFPASGYRGLIYQSMVPINCWYIATPHNAGTISASALDAKLDADFADLRTNGFTSITYMWEPVKHKSTLFENLTEHDMMIQINMRNTANYIDSQNFTSHHNAPILTMEQKLLQDGLNTVVEGTTKMKDHPQLYSYYLNDEPGENQADALQLAAMMVKALDPNHSGTAAVTGNHGSHEIAIATRASFLEQVTYSAYPLNRHGSGSPTGDFSENDPFNANLGKLSVADHAEIMSLRFLDRDIEVIAQAFGNSTHWRRPEDKELRALIYQLAARGSRPLSYFIYQYTLGGDALRGLLNTDYTHHANMAEAAAANAKLNGWMDVYPHLVLLDNGTDINYPEAPASTNTLLSNGFETGSLFSATRTTEQADTGSYSGRLSASPTVRSSVHGRSLDLLPRYDQLKYTVRVFDNGNASQKYQLGVMFMTESGNFVSKYNTYTNPGSGWQTLSMNLDAYAQDPAYIRIEKLFFRAYNPNAYVQHYIDNVSLTARKPAHRPGWQMNGGVVGDFLDVTDNSQYLIVVNTDVNTEQIIPVRVVGAGTQPPGTAIDHDSGEVFVMSDQGGYSLLSVQIPEGSARLLKIEGPVDEQNIYFNDHEGSGSFSGGTRTPSHPPYSGSYTVQLPGNGVHREKQLWQNGAIPGIPVDGALYYQVHVDDNNNPSQKYKLMVRFGYNDGSWHETSSYSQTAYASVGNGWNTLYWDLTGIAQTRMEQGYTHITRIAIKAYNTSTYSTFYVDDVKLAITNPLKTLYGNDMELGGTYGGGTMSTAAAHSPVWSQQFPASNAIRERKLWNNGLLPTGTLDNFHYSAWVYDGGDPSQKYQLLCRFGKNNGSWQETSVYYTTTYASVGSGWTQLYWDITSLVENMRNAGYTHMTRFDIRAYNPGTYVPYYVDDVEITYQNSL